MSPLFRTPFVKGESINISSTWRISGNIAPGSTLKKRRMPPKKQRK
jgi:hypothetical protein